MKAVGVFVAVAAAALVAAGCSSGAGSSSGGGSALPSTLAPSSVQAAAADAIAASLAHPNYPGCSRHDRRIVCVQRIVVPLTFDGSTFAVASSCRPNAATPYVAPTSGPLTLTGSVSIAPTCVPSPQPSGSPTSSPTASPTSPSGSGAAPDHGGWRDNSALYIVAVHDSGHGHHAVAPRDGLGRPALVAGPAAITDDPWVFAPDSPGLTMHGGASYSFYIIAVPATGSPRPSPTPRPTPSTTPGAGLYHALVPLTYDGTSLRVASSFTSCGQWWDETPYVAPTSEPLTLPASGVAVTPTCVPSPVPSSAPQLYVVAARLPDLAAHSRNPRDWTPTFLAFPIAGPVDASSASWSFAPLAPGLTMVGNDGYLFFVAAQSQFWRHGTR
ncbi:MAG TPA: hypothetical protein VMH02_10235 [Verrucomicrobiae bacterium]|nr:hypothetical protein [Verrucomicrobiae bacterium]